MQRIGNIYLDPLKIEAIFRDKEDNIFCLIQGRNDPIMVWGKINYNGYYCNNISTDDVAQIVNRAKAKITNYEFLLEELEITMDEWEISVRTRNCIKELMKNSELKTVADLINLGQKKLLETPNFGRKSLNELKLLFALKYNQDIPM